MTTLFPPLWRECNDSEDSEPEEVYNTRIEKFKLLLQQGQLIPLRCTRFGIGKDNYNSENDEPSESVPFANPKPKISAVKTKSSSTSTVQKTILCDTYPPRLVTNTSNRLIKKGKSTIPITKTPSTVSTNSIQTNVKTETETETEINQSSVRSEVRIPSHTVQQPLLHHLPPPSNESHPVQSQRISNESPKQLDLANHDPTANNNNSNNNNSSSNDNDNDNEHENKQSQIRLHSENDLPTKSTSTQTPAQLSVNPIHNEIIIHQKDKSRNNPENDRNTEISNSATHMDDTVIVPDHIENSIHDSVCASPKGNEKKPEEIEMNLSKKPISSLFLDSDVEMDETIESNLSNITDFLEKDVDLFNMIPDDDTGKNILDGLDEF